MNFDFNPPDNPEAMQTGEDRSVANSTTQAPPAPAADDDDERMSSDSSLPPSSSSNRANRRKQYPHNAKKAHREGQRQKSDPEDSDADPDEKRLREVTRRVKEVDLRKVSDENKRTQENRTMSPNVAAMPSYASRMGEFYNNTERRKKNARLRRAKSTSPMGNVQQKTLDGEDLDMGGMSRDAGMGNDGERQVGGQESLERRNTK